MVLVALVARKPGLADRGAHPAEELVARRPDDDPTVTRLETVVRRAERVLVADAPGAHAESGGDRRPRVGDREDRVLIREVEGASLAATVAVEDPGDHAEGEVETTDEVTERAAAARRWAVGEAGDRHETARGLGDDVVGDLPRARARRAEARERGDHEARVAGAQHVGPQPFGRHPPGAEVFDHGVGAIDETQEDLASLRRADIERDRALAAVGILEGERGLAFLRGTIAEVVAGARALDLDDVGAEVGENRGRKRPGDYPAEIEDANSFEHARRHGRAS